MAINENDNGNNDDDMYALGLLTYPEPQFSHLLNEGNGRYLVELFGDPI